MPEAPDRLDRRREHGVQLVVAAPALEARPEVRHERVQVALPHLTRLGREEVLSTVRSECKRVLPLAGRKYVGYRYDWVKTLYAKFVRSKEASYQVYIVCAE